MSSQPMTARRIAGGLRRRAKRLRRAVPPLRRPVVPEASAADGFVEKFSRHRVRGWATSPEGTPVRVALFVNDLEVAAAWASDPLPDRPDARFFQLRLKDVWTYVGRHDRLTVRADGRALPIAEHGAALTPARFGSRALKQLRAKFADGFIFDQNGKLRLSKKLDIEWQATVMGLYQQVRSLVGERFGFDVFLVYGTLLGAVREGSVIGHDVDFDCAFVSDKTTGRGAAADLRDVALYLIDHGLDVEVRATALHLHDADDPSIRIDLFHLFFDENGLLAAPFGVAGTTVIRREDWTGTKEIDFCGGRALVPVNDEAFAAHLYGDSWRLPKPGFEWNRDRTSRADSGFLPWKFRTTVLWENVYEHRPPHDGPSPFAQWLLANTTVPDTVLDIGSGDGRDSVFFAASGRRVVGLERSPRGLALARGRDSEVAFVGIDIVDADFGAVLAEARGDDGPVLFYARFLVHAVDADTEQHLLAALARAARPGDLLAFEFRTELDRDLPKAYGKHFRRWIDPEGFDARLTAAGFTITSTETGTGLAPFRTEDPQIHRVLATR